MASLENRISGTITPLQKSTILAAFTSIRSNMPFLINLTPDDRLKKRKTGTKREGYVVSVHDAGTGHPEAIPSTFDMAEWDKDEALCTVLKQIYTESLSVTEAIDDTLLQLGFERIKQADLVYDYLQSAAKGNAALTTLVEQIQAAFAGQGRRAPIPTTVIPIAGAIQINNAVVDSNFINEGDTVVKVTINNIDIMVRPGDITKITNKVVLATNISTTTEARIAVKTK